MDNTPRRLYLKSKVGLIGGVSLTAGGMIGSGIFMSPQTALWNIRSPGASLVIWAASAVLSVLESLNHPELEQ